MDAPSKVIFDLLNDETRWEAAGNVDYSAVSFIDGICLHPKTRLSVRAVSVEVYKEGEGAQPRNRGRTVFTDVVAVDCRVRIDGAVTQQSAATANALLQQVIEQVRSVVKTYSVRPAVGVEVLLFRGGRPLHGEGEAPPYVGQVVSVGVKYNV